MSKARRCNLRSSKARQKYGGIVNVAENFFVLSYLQDPAKKVEGQKENGMNVEGQTMQSQIVEGQTKIWRDRKCS